MMSSIRVCVRALLLASAPLICGVAYGQATPAASSLSPTVGPSIPTIDGIFHYSLSGSELIQTGYRGSGVGATTVLSGNAGYNSESQVHPFSMVYAGGLMMGNQYSSTATTFQNLALSQGLVKGAWLFGVADSVSYLPQSPTLGLSGIPGVGDLGPYPTQGPGSGPAGGVISSNMTSVSNSLSGNVERRLTALTSISGTGAWTILRYPDSFFGLDNTSYMGQVGLNHRLDARDTVSGGVSYSTFSYGSGIDLTMQTRGINGSFQRVLSHTLSLSVSAGPMWINSSNKVLMPATTTVSANGSLTYVRELTSASLSYNRGVNGGSGVQPGAISDNVNAMIGRSYGREWMASLTANYTRTNGLLNPGAVTGVLTGPEARLYSGGNSNSVYGGLQVSRRLTGSLSAYGSYNIQHQSSTYILESQNAFSGTSHIFGFGITYSPRATRLGMF
ncbi:MAG TPA: hypothetical protein VFE38_16965 [Edaphobacter sp.]|nr:hypothetical protein [Edaphobacter sp.]